MGLTVLGEILENWQSFALDDSIYLPADAEPRLDTVAIVVAFEPRKKKPEGYRYFLGIEQLRDVVEGLEGQLKRPASARERLLAAVHYAGRDAFIDPKLVL